ncbi:DUF5134 domain-containing protein [Streptomyces sp. NPDC020742]|uniref:DUF5134 domain-containing protein n=1 Tax=Streptomyces sp. NPDC020742 TaxID=3154897 RepID=UPI0033D3EB7D
MHGPPLVGWLLVVLCAGAGAYCLLRARGAPAARRWETRGEGLMALGMAAMALPASVVAPPAWTSWLFTAGFGAAGLWSLVHRHLHHAVGALAMVYMALAMVLPGDAMSHAGHSGAVDAMARPGAVASLAHSAPGGVPLLTGLLLAYYTVYVLAAGVRLVPASGAVVEGTVPGAAVSAAGAGPAVVLRACRVAMGIGMLAMLLTL